MSATRTPKQFTVSHVVIRGRSSAGRPRACDAGSVVSALERRARGEVGSGRAVGVRRLLLGGPCACRRLHRRHPRRGAVKPCPAGRCASPVGPGLDSPAAGAGGRLVSHTIRREQRGKEDTMNRWTGTGHLTKDPKFLETENGTAICTLRIAVKRAGKQGHDGYFDVKCFDAQASACAQYLKAGREVAVDGRLLFDEFQTQDGSYASRIYIVAERVEFLASRKSPNGQASDETSTDQPAGDRAAREAHQAA